MSDTRKTYADVEAFAKLVAEIGEKFTTAVSEREVLLVAMRQFANPANWDDTIANLRWTGKRHAIDYARAVLQQLGRSPDETG